MGMCNNNCGCNNNNCGCGCGGKGFFEGYQAFWIIVVIAIVIIWVHCNSGCFGGGCHNNNCCQGNCDCNYVGNGCC